MTIVEQAPTARQRKARQRNPRRVVLEMIKEALDITRFMKDRWSHVPDLSFYRDPGADNLTHHWPPRKRADIPASEYYENDPRYWAELHAQMLQLEEKARKIRAFAKEQYVATGGKLSG